MPQAGFKRPESVLVVIYTVAGEVLLLERREPAGFWQSVTGSLRSDETPMQTARREVSEETGIVAGAALVDCAQTNRFPILPAWRHRYAPEVEENVEHLFGLAMASKPAIVLSAEEHTRYRWLPRDEAAQLASSHTNRDAILALVPAWSG